MALVLLIRYLLSQSSGVHLWVLGCLFFVVEFVYGVVIFTKEMTMLDNSEAFYVYYRIVFVRLLIHLLRSLLLLFLSSCLLTVFGCIATLLVFFFVLFWLVCYIYCLTNVANTYVLIR